MQPRNIKSLGFSFFGGEVDGCLFIEHPETLKDTFKAIEDAKALLKDSGSQWAEMTMVGKDGRKELIKLYSEQFSQEKTSKLKISVPAPTALDNDPYNWAHYN